MINLDSFTNKNNKEQMAIYSRPFVQTFDNWWFWVSKNKRIALFNKGTRRYCHNLFVCKRFK